MARSYGSYFRQRDLDKPYRGAEIVLGFLGDMMAAKNQQALGYEKLAADQEKTQALKEHREDTLKRTKPWTDRTSGQSFMYSEYTGGYTVPVGGGGGQQHWGRVLSEALRKEHLQGAYGEDHDGDGQPDEFWAGPQAQDWHKYITAKDNKEEGWEELHPTKVLERKKAWKWDDEKTERVNRRNFHAAQDYLEGIQKHQDVYAAIETLNKLPENTKHSVAQSLYELYDEQFTDKLERADITSISSLMSEKNKLAAMVRDEDVYESFEVAGGPAWGAAPGTEVSIGEMKPKSKRTGGYDLTEPQKQAYIEQISIIEDQLDRYKKYGFTYPKFFAADPLGVEE